MTVFTCDPNLQEKQDFFAEISRIRESLQISLPVFETFPASSVIVYSIFFVNYPEIKLKKPVKLVYERGYESGAYIIGNDELNKYGIGKTKEEALKDFEDNLVADYLELKECSTADLAGDAEQLLRIYRGYFEN